jgi:hypothetical protein
MDVERRGARSYAGGRVRCQPVWRERQRWMAVRLAVAVSVAVECLAALGEFRALEYRS